MCNEAMPLAAAGPGLASVRSSRSGSIGEMDFADRPFRERARMAMLSDTIARIA